MLAGTKSKIKYKRLLESLAKMKEEDEEKKASAHSSSSKPSFNIEEDFLL